MNSIPPGLCYSSEDLVHSPLCADLLCIRSAPATSSFSDSFYDLAKRAGLNCQSGEVKQTSQRDSYASRYVNAPGSNSKAETKRMLRSRLWNSVAKFQLRSPRRGRAIQPHGKMKMAGRQCMIIATTDYVEVRTSRSKTDNTRHLKFQGENNTREELERDHSVESQASPVAQYRPPIMKNYLRLLLSRSSTLSKGGTLSKGQSLNDLSGGESGGVHELPNECPTVLLASGSIQQGSSQISPTLSPKLEAIDEEKKEYVTLRLSVGLREGHGLAVRDASGSSDPYVVVKYGNKEIYRSRTIYQSLSPMWDEKFDFLINDPGQCLQLEVFDYDRITRDEYMGGGEIELDRLKWFKPHEMKVVLEDSALVDEYLGYLNISLSITPLTESEREEFLAKANRGVLLSAESLLKRRRDEVKSAWLANVNVMLVEAKLYKPCSSCVKFKLGSEKYKSKVLQKTQEPKFNEQFDLQIYDENTQQMDVMLQDRSSSHSEVIGQLCVDLAQLTRDKTHELWYDLNDERRPGKIRGKLLLLITVTQRQLSSATTEMAESVGVEGAACDEQERRSLLSNYSIARFLFAIRDIGHLTVQVHRADGLRSADPNGQSDPFSVLELVNARLQTETRYRTLSPEWHRTFHFYVKDIHEALCVTIYDEDPNKKVEFLGRVAIPLLSIKNGQRRWYSLKDQHLAGPAKGRILLEMDLIWNPIRAAIRTFTPRERRFMDVESKFSSQLLSSSVNRLKSFGQHVVAYKEFVQSCLAWDSYRRSTLALTVFIGVVYFVELWHLPLVPLYYFAKSLARRGLNRVMESRAPSPKLNGELDLTGQEAATSQSTMGKLHATSSMDDLLREYDGEEDAAMESISIEDGHPRIQQKPRHQALSTVEESPPVSRRGKFASWKKKEAISLPATPTRTMPPEWKKGTTACDLGRQVKRKNFFTKRHAQLTRYVETLTIVQNSLDFLASLLERVVNTFNFTVPYLSYLAIFVFIAATLILYFIPIRLIIIVWGINKFSKRLRDPHYVDNNELLDFLSRVPSDKEMIALSSISRPYLKPIQCATSSARNAASDVGGRNKSRDELA